jgi:flagellar hook-length control protein FliK
MEVARERILTPSLFDVVAPRAASDVSKGPSFRDCFSPGAPGGSPGLERKPQDDHPPPQADPIHVEDSESKPAANQSAAADASSNSSSNSDSTKPKQDTKEEKKERDGDADQAQAAIAAAVVTPQKAPDESSTALKAADAHDAKKAVADPAGAATPLANKVAGESATAATVVDASATGEQLLAAGDQAVESIAHAGKENAAQLAGEATQQRVQAAKAAVLAQAKPVASAKTSKTAGGHENEPGAEAPARPAEQAHDAKPQSVASENAAANLGEQPNTDHSSETKHSDDHVAVDANHPAPNAEKSNSEAAAAPPAIDLTVNAQRAPDQPSPAPPATSGMTVNPTAQKLPPILRKLADSQPESAARSAEIDPARFLHRVAKAFESAQQRESEVRLRLHPAELGSLSIEVKVQDSVLTARVHAETPEAKAAIIDNLPALRERLADQGIRIDQFDVDLRDQSQPQQQSLQEQAREQTARRESAPRDPVARRPAAERADPVGPRQGRNGGLNVIV